MRRPADDGEDGSPDATFHWDLATGLLVTTVIVIVLYLTFELWMPHWGTQ